MQYLVTLVDSRVPEDSNFFTFITSSPNEQSEEIKKISLIMIVFQRSVLTCPVLYNETDCRTKKHFLNLIDPRALITVIWPIDTRAKNRR